MPRLLPLLIVTPAAGALAVESMPSRPAHAAFPGANGKIAFTSNRDGNGEIYVMNADGSAQTNVTNYAGQDGLASWSPDGSRIAFLRGRLDDPSIIDAYQQRLDGTGLTKVASGVYTFYPPMWSPDGSKIAIEARVGILIVEPDGSPVATIDGGFAPVWSPDGSRLAFIRGSASAAGGTPAILDVYTVDADGSNERNVSNALGAYHDLAWSPDGSTVAATFAQNTYLMPARETGHATPLPYQADTP